MRELAVRTAPERDIGRLFERERDDLVAKRKLMLVGDAPQRALQAEQRVAFFVVENEVLG